jgi:hypothetical protein
VDMEIHSPWYRSHRPQCFIDCPHVP